jgi:hypothetical protein
MKGGGEGNRQTPVLLATHVVTALYLLQAHGPFNILRLIT